MAIFHLHVKNISRGEGRSVVAAAAYRAGETLPNEREERESAFGGRRDVLLSEISCPDGAPGWMSNRAALWNGVEAAEKRKDARLAKEIEAALPRELPPAAWLALVRSFAAHYTSRGFVADLAIHDDGTAHNPHFHLLLTTRIITAEGFAGKIRSADGRQFVEEARALWAKLVNEALAQSGLGLSVDPRSHARAGVDRIPTQHRGPDPEARKARRDKMGLGRLLPPRISPESSGEHEGRLQEWPSSQVRVGITEDPGLPAPGPRGTLISQDELNQAQERMLAAMEEPGVSRRWAQERGENGRGASDEASSFVTRRWANEVQDLEIKGTHRGTEVTRRWRDVSGSAASDSPKRDDERVEQIRQRTRD